MGYIGSSPVNPKTAFSVRLLRQHDLLWQECSVSTQGYCKALEYFLDAHNSPILTEKSQQVCIL